MTLRPLLPDAEVTYGNPFGSTFVWSQLVLPMHQARLRRHGGGITDNTQQRLRRSSPGLAVHWDTSPCARLPRASARTSSTCCSVSPVDASTEKCASTCTPQAVSHNLAASGHGEFGKHRRRRWGVAWATAVPLRTSPGSLAYASSIPGRCPCVRRPRQWRRSSCSRRARREGRAPRNVQRYLA